MTNFEQEQLDNEQQAEKLFNFRPLFFAAVFLCLGIVAFYFYRFKNMPNFYFLFLLPIGAFPFVFCRNGKQAMRIGFSVALCGIFFFGGGFLFNRQMDNFSSGYACNGDASVRGKIASIQPLANDGYKLCLTDVRIEGKEVEGKLIAYLPAIELIDCEVSDVVLIYGETKSKLELVDKNGELRVWEIADNLQYICYGESAAKLESSNDPFLYVQKRMKKVTYAGMDEQNAALTIGLLIGDTSGIEDGLYDNLRYSGIAHIFSVSGSNVGSLFGFCLLLIGMTKGKMNKLLRFLFVAAVLLFYMGVCNYTSSVVRATIMCLVLYAFRLFNLSTDFLETLGFSAIIVLAINPVTIFNVGFQLSYAACLGIALLVAPIRNAVVALGDEIAYCFGINKTQKELEAIEKGDTLPPGIGKRIGSAFLSFLAMTLGAQIFTAPILLKAFGELSGWSTLLNCIFVPVLSAMFTVLLVFVTVACCLPVLFSKTILYVVNVALAPTLLAFETMDFSSLQLMGVKFPAFATSCYYATLIFLSDKLNIKNWYKLLFAILCFLGLTVAMVAMNV